MASRKKVKSNNRIEMLGISLVVVVLFSIMFVQSNAQKEKNIGYEQKIENLERELEKESERSDEISELESEVKTSDYAGEIARERLGLVGEDEILFRKEK